MEHRSTPLVVDDKLYVLGSYWNLVCMNTANGQTIWSVDLEKEYGARNNEWGISENLLYDGNVLYCTPGGKDASLVALDRNTGKMIWKSKGNGNKSAYCSPIMIKLQKRKIIVTMMEKAVCAFDAATGQQLWEFEHINDTGVHPNIPVFINGYLYCTSGYGKGGELLKLADDGSSVTEVWRTKDLDSRTGGVVVLNGKIYGSGDKNRKMFCLDWKQANRSIPPRIWPRLHSLLTMVCCIFTANQGRYSLQSRGQMASGLSVRFPFPYGANTHWAHLVIKDKKLYLRHGTSLMVYDIAAN